MGKKSTNMVDSTGSEVDVRSSSDAEPKMKKKKYEKEMRRLQGELVSMQVLVKYWLNVGVAEQTRRLESRIEDPRKVWKLSPTDLKSYSKHYEYCRARDAMLAATDTGWAPWFVVENDDKKRGRLNIISHLLS